MQGSNQTPGRRASIEANLVKFEEPEPIFRDAPLSQPNLRSAESSFRMTSPLESSNSLASHLSNLSAAFQKNEFNTSNTQQTFQTNPQQPLSLFNNQMQAYPNSQQQGLFNSQVQTQSLILNRPMNSLATSMDGFSREFPPRLQGSLDFTSTQPQQMNPINLYNRQQQNQMQYLQKNQLNLGLSAQKPIITHGFLPRAQELPLNANLNQIRPVNQLMMSKSHSIVPNINNQYIPPQLVQQQQKNFLALHQQHELQKKHLSSKVDFIAKLERKLEKSRQRKASLNNNKPKSEAENSAASLTDSIEGMMQEHSEMGQRTDSGLSFQDFRSAVSNYEKEGIDIEEHSIKHLGKFKEVSSLNSLDEEITTTGVSTKPTLLAAGVSMSLNSQMEGLTLQSVDRPLRKDSLSMSRSLPDIESASPITEDGMTSHNLQMIEENDDENIESPCNRAVPGTYTREERMERILRYKKKIMKWRIAHPLNRNFLGRSFVAGYKPRIKGKFVSKEEYFKHINQPKSTQSFNGMLPQSFSMQNIFGTKMEEM